MRYRDARLLSEGDEVIKKEDKQVLKVESIEAFGQFKTVKINVITVYGKHISLFNDEIE